jgi:DNA adenine methylase
MRRRAMPADEKHTRKNITGENLETGGKKNTDSIGASGILDEEEKEKTAPTKKLLGDSKDTAETPKVETRKNISIFVPLIKANADEQTITGLVLQPEVTDAQGDIMSASVIAKAAHNFLAKYNKATTLGLQHKYFGKYKFELYESWTAPQDVVINGTLIKSGSWVMTVKVLDAKIWDMVKKGELTGFSIGGKAKVQKVDK